MEELVYQALSRSNLLDLMVRGCRNLPWNLQFKRVKRLPLMLLAAEGNPCQVIGSPVDHLKISPSPPIRRVCSRVQRKNEVPAEAKGVES